MKVCENIPNLVSSCSPVHPPPHLRDGPKARAAGARRWDAWPASPLVQGQQPTCHGQHPAGGDGNTRLPGEEGQVPGNRQGMAPSGLRVGRAAVQSLLGGHGGLQHHTGHLVVGLAGRLSAATLLM